MQTDTEALRHRYETKEYTTQLKAQWLLFEQSIALVEQHKDKLGDVFPGLCRCYKDAQTVYQDETMDGGERRKLLYRIYDAYFAQLAGLPWALRWAVRCDKHMRRMRVLIKRGSRTDTERRYWISFAKWCIPALLVGLWGEVWFLDVLYETVPLWRILLSLVMFLGGFGWYMYFVYRMEGRRVYADLEKWISFKLYPADQEKPMELVQYIKMSVPLAVALGSAFIKMYLQ